MDHHNLSADDYQHLPRPVGVLGKSYPAGSRIAPHHHRRGQFLYAASGIMQVVTDNAIHMIPSNRALWLPPGVRHGLSFPEAVALRTLYIDPEVPMFDCAAPRSLAMTPLVRALILRLWEEPPLYDTGGTAGLAAALLLAEIPRLPPVSLSASLPEDPRLRALGQAILDTPASDWSVGRAADQAGVSPRTLERHIHARIGLSYGRWRQQLVMLAAMSLLASDRPIARLAHELGYAHTSAFAAAFKRQFGQSPGALRLRLWQSGSQTDGQTAPSPALASTD